MQNHQRILLDILASALFRRPMTPPDVKDWGAVMREAQAQAVLPLVVSTAKGWLPPELRKKWEFIRMQAYIKNMEVIAAHGDIHQRMTKYGIPYVILKGCASARYYPHPDLRTMGDVDFLVEKSDLEHCEQQLLNDGMKRVDDGQHGYHRRYLYQEMPYELHWEAPMIPRIGGDQIRAALADIIRTACTVRDGAWEYCVPDNFHHGMVLLLHTAGHMTAEGIGLRHLCDWAVYIDSMTDAFVLGELAPRLRDCGLWEFARVLTAISSRFLGAKERTWATGINTELLDKLMDDILAGGNFGLKEKHRQKYASLTRNAETRQMSDRSVASSFAAALDHSAGWWFPGLHKRALTRPLAWVLVSGRHLYLVAKGKRIPVRLWKDGKIMRTRKELFRQLRLFEKESE